MMRKDFYVTLPSNCAIDVFPDNATSHYTTPLHRRIDFSGDYEVGVTEIHYPTLIENVSSGNNEITIRTVDPDVLTITLSDAQKEALTNRLGPLGNHSGRLFVPTGGVDRRPVDVVHYSAHSIFKILTEEQREAENIKSVLDLILTTTVAVPPGHYTQIEQLLKFINEQISDVAKLSNTDSNKISVSIKAPPMVVMRTAVYFSDILAMQLGFPPGTDILSCSSSEHPADLSRGIPQQIFIYGDFIEPQFVGDVSAPLLRTVNARVSKIQWGLATQVFNSPYYIRVNKRSISSIEVHIRDAQGSYISFLNGTSTVVLHFKPVG